MSRQDVKQGTKSSEFLLATAGLVAGLVGAGAGALALPQLQGVAAVVGGALLSSSSVVAYLFSRSKVKVSAHAPAPIAPGGRVV